MHFFNPVPVMSLVEVVRGRETSDETAEAITELARELGKTPAVANDFPGFVSNRILMPFINEAVWALHEGVAEPEAIDTIAKLGFNHPLGPLALADLIGLDTCVAIMEVLRDGLGDDALRALSAAPRARRGRPARPEVGPGLLRLLVMDFELTSDQKEIQALAREFAQAEIEPHAAQWDREHHFPKELFGKLAELGLMGACVPEEYGGAGADFLSYILMLEEISRADAGVGVTVAVHTSAVTLPILTFGTDEQRARFVPPLARGELIGAFALTETEAGSDAGSLRTSADRRRRRLDDLRHEAVHLDRPFRGDVPPLRAHRPGHSGRQGRLRVHPRRRPRPRHAARRRSSASTRRSPNSIAVEGAQVERDRLLHEEGKGFTRRDGDARRRPDRDRRAGARDRAGRVRRRARLRARAEAVRQAHRRVPGDPVEAR